jgi:Flp pilus assembly protein TadG
MDRWSNVRNERGSGVVEFALVLPILAILTVAIMDFSLAMWSQHTLASAARDGARYATIRQATDDEITQKVKDSAFGLTPSKMEVLLTFDPNREPGSTVHITVRYPFDPVTPFVPARRVTLEASADMVVLR